MEKNQTLNREIVINKAVELAEVRGIDSVTYNGLARELGIRPQSMYRYVSNIKDLRTEIISLLLSELVGSLAGSVKILPREEAIRQFAMKLYDECHRNPLYYEAFNLMHSYMLIDEMETPLRQLTDLIHILFLGMTGDSIEEGRYEQFFMALNLGYAQMAMTCFFPQSMRDDRDNFSAAIDDLIRLVSKKEKNADTETILPEAGKRQF